MKRPLVANAGPIESLNADKMPEHCGPEGAHERHDVEHGLSEIHRHAALSRRKKPKKAAHQVLGVDDDIGGEHEDSHARYSGHLEHERPW
jgi:hypothetical protein